METRPHKSRTHNYVSTSAENAPAMAGPVQTPMTIVNYVENKVPLPRTIFKNNKKSRSFVVDAPRPLEELKTLRSEILHLHEQLHGCREKSASTYPVAENPKLAPIWQGIKSLLGIVVAYKMLFHI